MTQICLYSFISVLAISVISLIGVITLYLREERLKKILSFLVAFAAGALLGDVFIHIVPEVVFEFSFTFGVSLYFLCGILAFFVLEKFFAWRHCHNIECEEHSRQRLGKMNLVGDGLHNLIDGMLIAGSFLVSVPIGLATAVAVALHEIPQELGDFGVLIHSGYTRNRALLYNLLSALVALVGLVIVLLVGTRVQGLTKFLLPFTGGSFIYIAASGIIPELHKEGAVSKSLIQLLGLVLGIGVMTGLLVFG